MLYIVDSLKLKRNEYQAALDKELGRYFLTDSASAGKQPHITTTRKDLVYARVLEKLRSVKNIILSHQNRIGFVQGEIDKYMVEVHKKYSLPAACVVFVLLGAPLGVMVKKGGFGVAASISLFFFLLYWAFLIGGEKLSERAFFSPFWGMWTANILLGIAGIILTVRSAKETVTLNFSFIKKFIPKQWQPPEEGSDENPG
jgi:lipopolysaccharide export system permease protein